MLPLALYPITDCWASSHAEIQVACAPRSMAWRNGTFAAGKELTPARRALGVLLAEASSSSARIFKCVRGGTRPLSLEGRPPCVAGSGAASCHGDVAAGSGWHGTLSPHGRAPLTTILPAWSVESRTGTWRRRSNSFPRSVSGKLQRDPPFAFPARHTKAGADGGESRDSAIEVPEKKGQGEQQSLATPDEMSGGKGDTLPNSKAYRAAIAACGEAGQWRQAVALMRQMQKRGIAADDASYGASIEACARGGKWQHALALLKEMTMMGVPPGLVSYNAAIAACGSAGQSEEAIALLRKMRQQRTHGVVVTPDGATYNAAITACEKKGQWEHALTLLGEMEEDECVVPDEDSYRAAIAACGNAGKCKEVQQSLNVTSRVLVARFYFIVRVPVSLCSVWS